MSEEDLNRLYTYIVEYSSGDIFHKVSPVKVDSQLKVLTLYTLTGISAKLSANHASRQPHL